MGRLDTSIFQLVKPRSVDDFTAEADAAEARKLTGESNRLQLLLQREQMEQGRQAQAEDKAFRMLYADPTFDLKTPESQRRAMATSPRAAQVAIKAQLDSEKTRGEIGKNDAETKAKQMETLGKAAEMHRDQLRNVTSPQAAAQWLTAGYNDPVVGAVLQRAGKLEDVLARIPTDEAGFQKWRLQASAGIEKFIEMTKPVIQTRNTGGTTDTLAIDPLTGQPKVTGSVANTQSPDSKASTAVQLRGQDLVNARAVEANKLKAQEVANSTESGLPVLGVPKPTVTPWQNQSNPKDANKVKLAEATRGAKEVEKDVDAARKEAATAQAAARFIELNKSLPTGGVVDKVAAGRWVKSMGADYAELESITAKLAPAMREPGSGSTSDFDGKQFERATVGVDKPQKANENIAHAIIARAELSQDYAEFRQTYLEQNGTLAGADRHWKAYTNKNPIFDPSKQGTFDLNKARKNWREHFKGEAPAAAPAAAPAPATPGARPPLSSFAKG